MGSFLADRWAEKPVTIDKFSEHGLGDKADDRKAAKEEKAHRSAPEVKKINEQLEKIDAPFFVVCKADGGIGYRKTKPSCDPKHDNVVYSRKKVVDEYLQEHKKGVHSDPSPAKDPRNNPHIVKIEPGMKEPKPYHPKPATKKAMPSKKKELEVPSYDTAQQHSSPSRQSSEPSHSSEIDDEKLDQEMDELSAMIKQALLDAKKKQ